MFCSKHHQREQLLHSLKMGAMLNFFSQDWASAASLAGRAADIARSDLPGSSVEQRLHAQHAAAQFSLIAGESLRRAGDLTGSLQRLGDAYRARLDEHGDAHPSTISARKCVCPRFALP